MLPQAATENDVRDVGVLLGCLGPIGRAHAKMGDCEFRGAESYWTLDLYQLGKRKHLLNF